TTYGSGGATGHGGGAATPVAGRLARDRHGLVRGRLRAAAGRPGHGGRLRGASGGGAVTGCRTGRLPTGDRVAVASGALAGASGRRRGRHRALGGVGLRVRQGEPGPTTTLR